MLTRIAWLSLLILLSSACSNKTGEENQGQGDANPDTTATPTPTPTDQGNTGNGEAGATEVARRSLSSIALGSMHTCALTETGNVKCWGMSRYLGNGNDDKHKRLVPVDVLAAEGNTDLLDDIVQVSAGHHHSCALTSGGNVKCWGDANKGQLGNGNTADSNWPVYVIEAEGSSNTLDSIVQIDAGEFHTCVLTTKGGVKCWGNGEKGELGSTTKKDKNPAPVVIMGADSQPLTGVVQLAAGLSFNCAVTISGGVKCWGLGEQGQLGNGSYEDKDVPVDVVDADNKPLTGIVQITAGEDHACALTNTANVKCWGHGNMLGRGTNQDNKNVPVEVQALSGIAHLTGGDSHACAVSNIGNVKCWGEGAQGQLGNGETVPKDVPSDVIIEQGRSDLLKIATQRAEQVCYDDSTCKIE